MGELDGKIALITGGKQRHRICKEVRSKREPPFT